MDIRFAPTGDINYSPNSWFIAQQKKFKVAKTENSTMSVFVSFPLQNFGMIRRLEK
jgi:hypothetical protein